jgi:hypothetical protein
MPVDNSVANQKATPAIYASSLATRPAFGFVGRIFVDTDNPSTGLYRDTGSAWIQIADPGAGTTGTLQQVTTNGSSTTIGISTSGNGIGIGTTIPGSNRLDIHSGSGINATFNGTGVTNAALQFQLAGTGKWNVGNLYNSNNNDFIITDVVNTLNRVTIKNTGQTFIGTDTTSSGLFVVNSSTSDNHYVAIGSNAPSYRLRDVGSGGALNCGIGISTATNNFIQGSASGNYCIFNSSSTASPILFGVYDAGTGNTQEAVRISAARNLLVGGVSDSGEKLQISGTSKFTGSIGATSATFSGTITTSGFIVDNSSGNDQLVFKNNGSFDWQIGGKTGDATQNFSIYNYGTSSRALFFDKTTNAATFSNSLTLSNSDARFLGGDTTGRIVISNSNTTSYIAINGATNSSPYSLNFISNSIVGLTIASTGATTFPIAALFSSSIDIGTSVTGYKLGIVAPSGANANLIISGVNGVTNGFTVRYVTATTRIILNIANIPTSAVGLNSGDIYSNAGILTIVP